MKTLLIAGLALAPLAASAQGRIENRGHAGSVEPKRSSEVFSSRAGKPGSAPAAATPAAAPAAPEKTAAKNAPASGPALRGFSASGVQAPRAGARDWGHFGRPLGAPQRIERSPRGAQAESEAPSGPEQEPETVPAQPAAQAYAPGALIRTEGLGFKNGPADQQRTHAVEAGEKIAYESGKGRSLTNHRGLFVGPRDTPPNPSPGGGSGGGPSGNNSITEVQSSAPGLGNGNTTPRGRSEADD